MHHSDNEKAQAVMFFGKEGVSRELLYPEFEALLDGYVPMTEYADTEQKAVYIEFDSDFCVTAAVFFTMSIDGQGAIDPSWNLPLVDMARTAATGPNLGAGPIHLVCLSQCPVAYFADWLWDPDMRADQGHFLLIAKALKRNRLGLYFKKKEKPREDSNQQSSAKGLDAKKIEQQLSQQYEKELRSQVAQMLQDQRLRETTMTGEKEGALKELRLEHVKKIESLQSQIEEKQAAIDELEFSNKKLKATIDGQVKKIEGLREYFEHKLERAQGEDEGYIDGLKAQYEAETEAKIAAATKEFNDLIRMKELELNYHAEHENELSEELKKLRSENQELLSNSGDHLLEKLSRKGVNFVTYQPGAGHITIPFADMPKFLENPNGFTAAYCGVSEKHYQAWLKHYQTPVCCALNESGEMCCADVPRIVNPEKFIPGDNDHCDKHRKP